MKVYLAADIKRMLIGLVTSQIDGSLDHRQRIVKLAMQQLEPHAHEVQPETALRKLSVSNGHQAVPSRKPRRADRG